MFEDFYHLTQNPFQINTDPKFLWLGEKHKEALAILQYGVLGNKSFLLLTGDVGTGKTTLINALLKGQGEDTLIATIQDPDLATLDLYNYIAHVFNMPERYDSKGKFLAGFSQFLRNQYYGGKKVLLIIDEAQRAQHEILEDIRILSNIEINGNKLINIFFVGQNEFNDTLAKDENKAIRQRITISYNIKPLTVEEVGKYIQFRLFKAGAKWKIFKNDAVSEIYKFTNGYPRLINILCDRCLLTGFVLGEKFVDKKIAKECFAEIEMSMRPDAPRQSVQLSSKYRKTAPSSLQPRSYMKSALLACLFFVFLGSGWFLYDRFPQWRPDFGEVAAGLKSDGAMPVSVDARQKNGADPTGSAVGGVGHGEEVGNEVTPGTAEESPLATSPAQAATEAPVVEKEGGDKRKRMTEINPVSLYGRKTQVFFQPDSISSAPEFVDSLEKFADLFLASGSRGQIVIRGYADSSGSAHYNKKLARFRADAVKTFLQGKGVAADKIVTIGAISDDSIDPQVASASPKGGARRVELEVVPTW